MTPPVPPVRSSWDRIDGWLREHAPASYENLAPGAGPGAVEEAQAEMGLRFPADLTDSLLCHDGLLSWGNVMPGPPPQSVAQIVRHWRMCVEIEGDEDPSEPGEPGEEPWWHPLWIPWAQSDGNAQVIDMREGPQQGRLGTACHDDTAHFEDGWPSLAAYLAEVADVLDHGGLADGCAPYLTCDGELWWDLEGETELNGDPLTPAPTPARAAALAARASWSLAELLGAPVRPADDDAAVIEAVARDWSVVRRGWADWHDTGLGFGEWFRGALAGVLATDWLPEWEPGPHPLEPGGS
ncbi:SMI1/KNR4 family protein [Streptomyces sp. NPDC001581]|uniref:SMI1/KNR4 family protein n=1 Tax=Streptomyces sp. NPDC001581 TaxID=3154386 RepID=UPI00332C51DF